MSESTLPQAPSSIETSAVSAKTGVKRQREHVHTPNKDTEHPFAPFVRILAKGKTGSRSLTEEESFKAFSMILDGEVEDVQLGAFLMLLRVKEETPTEQAGFTRAIRQYIKNNNFFSPDVKADIDWPSYAGKHKQLPWYLCAALLLAGSGLKVFMHGVEGHTSGRLYTEQALKNLGIGIANNSADIGKQLSENNFCFLPLEKFCSPLHRIIQLRNTFGVRSPVHSLIRMTNPLRCKISLQSVFHPSYAKTHISAALQLEQPSSLVIKGEGGEFEMRPDAKNTLHILQQGHYLEETWARPLPEKTPVCTDLNLDHLLDVWRGRREDRYGLQAIRLTSAAVLRMTKQCKNENEALSLAEDLWQKRKRDLI
ncbi:MAG: glycosyl transferase family protein [Pseudomonadales bacterium]|nr:glycosyl transferase family protein [Pseudomonadales bacterium]